MTERRVTVTDPAGLHARQAAGVVRVANRYGSRLLIRHAGREANARSMIEILGLAIEPSTEIALVADGEDADAALDALALQLAPPRRSARGRRRPHHRMEKPDVPAKPEGPEEAPMTTRPRMKKLINDTGDVVADGLAGLAAAYPDLLDVDVENRIVLRAAGPTRGKVALVSGGGSGHEPLHAGYVGQGMLAAACPGEVFTSPVPDQIERATRAADGGAGVLHIIKNYTGDVLNFQLAAELVAGEVEVASVVTNDDVSVEDSLYTAGRRGVGVTVLVEKMAGAAAEAGASLAEVQALAQRINERGRSMGLALTSCVVPSAGTPTFDLADDEVEVGIGIHGEPGRQRRKLATVDEMAEWLVSPVVSDLSLTRGDSVLAFVNGMGGTPLIELYSAYHSVSRILSGLGIGIARNLVGNYITSLEMAGFSVTLLRLDDELVRLWDAPVHTPALRWGT